MKLTPVQKDRAVGALMGLACGDALGAGHEFKPSVPYTTPIAMTGGGPWLAGEWTDDTAMALGIAQVSAQGKDLLSASAQDEIAANWLEWSKHTKDIGIQTQEVFYTCGFEATAKQMRVAAIEVHERNGRSAGNGSLMRTAPVALAYLDDREGLIRAAREISQLTHHEDSAAEACIIWCLAIRHCVLTGELPDLRDFVTEFSADRQAYWIAAIDEAEARESHEFEKNGWVVAALQAAWSAITHAQIPGNRPDLRIFPAQHFAIALERAVRCGGDTDTVAAIAGQVLGARWGASAIPLDWRRLLNGYPNMNHRDLMRLAVLTVQNGEDDNVGWPSIDVVDDSHWPASITVESFQLNSLITCGGHDALTRNPQTTQAAISLCRVGANETELDARHHLQIMIMDESGETQNQNLPFVFDQIAQMLNAFVTSNKQTVVHCVQAQSRTPSALIAYAMLSQGFSFDQALAEVRNTLPRANPNHDFVAALRSLEHNFESSSNGCGHFELYSEGELVLIAKHDGTRELIWSGNFGTLTRSGGAWVAFGEVYDPESFLDGIDLRGRDTQSDALAMIRDFDKYQFGSGK